VTIALSGGSSIEVEPNLEAGLDHGVPFFDAVTMRSIGYDAAILGD